MKYIYVKLIWSYVCNLQITAYTVQTRHWSTANSLQFLVLWMYRAVQYICRAVSHWFKRLDISTSFLSTHDELL